jgi:hypothetical protein
MPSRPRIIAARFTQAEEEQIRKWAASHAAGVTADAVRELVLGAVDRERCHARAGAKLSAHEQGLYSALTEPDQREAFLATRLGRQGMALEAVSDLPESQRAAYLALSTPEARDLYTQLSTAKRDGAEISAQVAALRRERLAAPGGDVMGAPPGPDQQVSGDDLWRGLYKAFRVAPGMPEQEAIQLMQVELGKMGEAGALAALKVVVGELPIAQTAPGTDVNTTGGNA